MAGEGAVAMSAQDAAANGGEPTTNSALRALRAATHEDAGANGGGGKAENRKTCDVCGDEFGNAGARATHERACKGERASDAGEASEKPQDGDVFLVTDMLPEEIADVCARMDARDAHATLAALDAKPQDGERIQHTVSKALARAHTGMDAQAYVAAFGECANDGCAYGANGIDATKCMRHE